MSSIEAECVICHGRNHLLIHPRASGQLAWICSCGTRNLLNTKKRFEPEPTESTDVEVDS